MTVIFTRYLVWTITQFWCKNRTLYD